MAPKRTAPSSSQPARKAVTRALAASAEPRVPLPGSMRHPLPESSVLGALTPPAGGNRVTVSVLVRRRQPIDPALVGQSRMTRAQFRSQFGAEPAAVKAVKAFAAQFGLTFAATPEQLAARTVQLTGTRAQLEQAFGVTLANERRGEHTYRVRTGEIALPESLAGLVEAVLGLDNRPQARPQFRIARHRPHTPSNASDGISTTVVPAAAGGSSFTPPQIAQLYQFPGNASAAGQTIGLIELGGGYRTADLKAYFASIGVPQPNVVAVPVDGGKNAPSTADGADGEVMLDIEVAAAVAPGANIAVYFAPNTDQGFIDAITTAVHDTTNKPSVISISWGGPESSWTGQALTALDSACQAAAMLGVSVTAAAGDNGSSDGVSDGANHVDFPASSPHVLACGGTRITATANTLTSEVVWNEIANNEGATGGGVSAVFAKPAWQASANVPPAPSATGGRGVPDVAGNADPATGYTIRVDGQTIVIGGTSAVAPLWAGLIALTNAQSRASVGFINGALYGSGAVSAFHDITDGNNGAFTAAAGWDACTGLGAPIGTAVIAALGGTGAPASGGGGGKTGGGSKGGKHPKRPRQPKASGHKQKAV